MFYMQPTLTFPSQKTEACPSEVSERSSTTSTQIAHSVKLRVSGHMERFFLGYHPYSTWSTWTFWTPSCLLCSSSRAVDDGPDNSLPTARKEQMEQQRGKIATSSYSPNGQNPCMRRSPNARCYYYYCCLVIY